jgi:3-hydroxyisobutyrate dehydrogenase
VQKTAMNASGRVIAVLGGGIMARAVVGRLHRARFRLRLYNRTRNVCDTLARDGDVVCASPADAALGAGAVWSFVHDDTASAAVWSGATGAFASITSGALAIESSTISTTHAGGWFADAVAHRARPLLAPVTGSRPAAETGTLVAFVGGAPGDRAAAAPLLATIAAQVIGFDTPTDATKVKLLNNALAAVILTGLAETLTAAAELGIAPEDFAAIVSRYGWAAPVATAHAQAIVDGEHTLRSCPLAVLAKDVRYTCDALGPATPPLIRTTAVRFQAAVAARLGPYEMSAISLLENGLP